MFHVKHKGVKCLYTKHRLKKRGNHTMKGDVLSSLIIGILIVLLMYYLDRKYKD